MTQLQSCQTQSRLLQKRFGSVAVQTKQQIDPLRSLVLQYAIVRDSKLSVQLHLSQCVYSVGDIKTAADS